ncbi:DUF3889 domain-containing protein [Paenibacillus sp. GXUN7292]|uniref:DUF3889 domain-containing protein n=1 Tax=Paenibacillus sp. GXUN7292 TaxID=3422499 RepID=UPI003D7C5CCA
MINLITVFTISSVSAEAVPDYAKWGEIAIEETQKRFDYAEIIDYKHIGRVDLAPAKSEEKFKLWLRNKEGNEFGVFITIQFDPTTDKIRSIKFL